MIFSRLLNVSEDVGSFGGLCPIFGMRPTRLMYVTESTSTLCEIGGNALDDFDTRRIMTHRESPIYVHNGYTH